MDSEEIKETMIALLKGMDDEVIDLLASTTKAMFDAYIEKGFTREEAIQFTSKGIINGK